MRESCGFLSFSLGVLVVFAGCSDEPNSPTCGNGIQDPDEACDDGNRDSGDACTATCQIPGTQLECVTLLEGMGSYRDEINALVSVSDLSFVAGGGLSVEDQQVGWIGRYDGSGAQMWLTWPPPVGDEHGSVIDIAADGSDGYWGLLTHGIEEELIHLDSTGQIDTRLLLADVVHLEGFQVSPARLLVIDGHIWLAGAGEASQGEGGDLWVGRLDIETQVLGTILIEDHAGFHDRVWAIARSESEVAMAATVDTGPSMTGNDYVTPHSNVLLIRFDLEGQEVGRNLLGAAEPGIATVAHSIAPDGNNGWIVGGAQPLTGHNLFLPQNGWVARVHPGGAGSWTLTSTEPAADIADVEDILASNHEVVAVGSTFADGETRSWLFGIGPDGTVHWEQKLQETGYARSDTTVAIWDHLNRLRTASRSWNFQEASVLRSCLVAW